MNSRSGYAHIFKPCQYCPGKVSLSNSSALSILSLVIRVVVILICVQGEISSASSEEVKTEPRLLVPHANSKEEQVDLFAWHPKYEEHCYFFGSKNPKTNSVRNIETALRVIQQEATIAVPLLETAREQGSAICIDDRTSESKAYFDYKYNVLAISHNLSHFERIAMLLHELRHIDHYRRGYCLSIDYDMNEMVRLVFAIEADSNAVSTLFAWRMKNGATPEVWNAMTRIEDYADTLAAFEGQMQLSGDELVAARAAFSQWYKSNSRTENYKLSSCMRYLDIIDEKKVVRKYTKLPKNYFDELCDLPSGENYGCHLTDEIQATP